MFEPIFKHQEYACSCIDQLPVQTRASDRVPTTTKTIILWSNVSEITPNLSQETTERSRQWRTYPLVSVLCVCQRSSAMNESTPMIATIEGTVTRSSLVLFLQMSTHPTISLFSRHNKANAPNTLSVLNNTDSRQAIAAQQHRTQAIDRLVARQAVSPATPRIPPTMSGRPLVELPNDSSVKANGSGTITGGLKKTVYLKLVEDRNSLNEDVQNAQKTLCEVNQTNTGLIQQVENMTKEFQTKNSLIENLNSSNREKNAEIQEKDKEIKTLQDDLAKHKDALKEAVEALKDAGKHAKSEQRKGVKDTTRDQIKNYHYRTVRFFHPQGRALTDR